MSGKTKKIIGIDIDDTIIPMSSRWKLYLEENTNKSIEDFFKQENLYNNIDIDDGIKKYIIKISELVDIVFISSCYEEHLDSKKDMLARNFYNIDYRFVSSHIKNNIPVDYMVDDREKVLDNMPKNTITLKANLLGVESDKHPVLSWKEIYNLVKEDNNAGT